MDNDPRKKNVFSLLLTLSLAAQFKWLPWGSQTNFRGLDMSNQISTVEQLLFRQGEEYVISVDTLNCISSQSNLRIVDVRSREQCPDGHISGAISLDVSSLAMNEGGNVNLLMLSTHIAQTLSAQGIRANDFVVAYDDDTGVDAARFLWALELLGHKKYALLDGGFAAWDFADLDISKNPARLPPTTYATGKLNNALATAENVFRAIDDDDTIIVDTRSIDEFSGSDARAQKAGHIPGAIHFDWLNAVDLIEGGTLKAPTDILQQLESLGITPNKKVIVYCQTNRRSSHTFVILKWLGFTEVQAYAGAWSEWGNRDWTPVEKGEK